MKKALWLIRKFIASIGKDPVELPILLCLRPSIYPTVSENSLSLKMNETDGENFKEELEASGNRLYTDL
jgi:hypothetical protein